MISFISHALSPPAGRGDETAGQDESVEEGWTENVSRTHDYQLIFVVNIYVLLILILLWDTCYLDHKRAEKVLWLGCLHNLGCHNGSADSAAMCLCYQQYKKHRNNEIVLLRKRKSGVCLYFQLF